MKKLLNLKNLRMRFTNSIYWGLGIWGLGVGGGVGGGGPPPPQPPAPPPTTTTTKKLFIEY